VVSQASLHNLKVIIKLTFLLLFGMEYVIGPNLEVALNRMKDVKHGHT